MKALLCFILGAIIGAWGIRLYDRQQAGSASAPDIGVAARDSAVGLKDEIAQKLVDWHLTGDDVRADLSRSGQVVRSNGRTAGERISDARIVAVIKAKYVLDRNLSARDLRVDSQSGKVTLTGSAPSPALIGHAIALALDTDGVTDVTSQIQVQP